MKPFSFYRYLGVCFLGIFSSVSAAGIPLNSDSGVSRGSLQTVIEAIGTYQSLQQSIREKNISLNFEENLEFPSLKKMAQVDEKILEKNKDLEELEIRFSEVIKRVNNEQFDESDENLVEGMILGIQEEIQALKNERLEYEEIYEGRKLKQQTSIKALKADLEDLDEELIKQKQLIRSQSSTFITYLFLFFGLILGFIVLKFFGRIIILRVTKTLSEQRQKALLQINNITFNVLLGAVFLGVIFSQFVNFLPFLAILGTGLAFAVRDTISSFIAWFVIGTDRGYKVGDIIEVGSMTGRVLEIKPVLTALIDLSNGWNSGKIITMPNKVIFEEKILNHSRCSGLFQKNLKFLLSQKSSIEEAKKILLSLIENEIEGSKEWSLKQVKKDHQCNYTFEDIAPKVWIETTFKGIELKARFFCGEREQFSILNNIQEKFTQFVQANDFVSFHFSTTENHFQNSKKNTETHGH